MNTLTLPMSRDRISAMLSNKKLLSSIRKVLRRRGVREIDMPDVIQEVFEAAFEGNSLPEVNAEAEKYVFGIARNKARMYVRKRMRDREDAFDGNLHKPHAAAPVEARDLLRKITAEIPESRWHSFTWFTRVTFGETLAEIAREEGVDYAVAHARFARIQTDLRKWATRVAATVAAVLVAIGAYRLFNPRPENVASPPPQVAPPSPPGAHERTIARELRLQAFDACWQGRWADCRRGLDEAKLHDPAGEAGPVVVELRQKLEAAAERERRAHEPPP